MSPRLEKAHYDLLNKLLQFCYNHNLAVFVVAGTLLGAHRHLSMIPWDDDIDVGLMDLDYERLLSMRLQLQDSGLLLKEKHNWIGIFDQSWGYSRWHTVPSIDVFPFERRGNKVQYARANLRMCFPREYFSVPEITSLQWYQFGPLQVPGPSNIEAICVRTWGPNWFQPCAKFMKRVLYPQQIQKMMKKYQRSKRYQELSHATIKS